MRPMGRAPPDRVPLKKKTQHDHDRHRDRVPRGPHRDRQCSRHRDRPPVSGRRPLFTKSAMIRGGSTTCGRSTPIRYAQKANSNLAVLDLVGGKGCWSTPVSAGEIGRAMAAGYLATGDPPPVVYTSDIFDHESLDLVVEKGIHVNCGSPDMIAQYGERAPGHEITLRVNPGFGHGHSQKTNTGGEHSKHGIWHEQIGECRRLAANSGLRIAGLHMHIGSGTDLEHLSQVCGALERVALAVGESITTISAGGGLPTPYRATDLKIDIAAYFELWDATRRRLQDAFGHAVRLEIEPGRYLVAESGYLSPRSGQSNGWGEHVLSSRRRFQQPRPADPLWRVPPDVDRAGRRSPTVKSSQWSSAARFVIGRHLHAIRRRRCRLAFAARRPKLAISS